MGTFELHPFTAILKKALNSGHSTTGTKLVPNTFNPHAFHPLTS